MEVQSEVGEWGHERQSTEAKWISTEALNPNVGPISFSLDCSENFSFLSETPTYHSA